MRIRKLPAAIMSLVLVSSFGLAAQAGEILEATVTITDNEFSPKTLSALDMGGVATWEYEGGGNQHNVAQMKGLFRSGDPSDQPFDYKRKFSAGTFPYKCQVHFVSQGMRGRVKIPVKISSSSPGPLIEWAAEGTNTGGKFDVQYKVADGNWKNWFQNTTKLGKVFGKNGSPVTYDESKFYSFRARSQKGPDADGKVSGWSPPRTISPL